MTICLLTILVRDRYKSMTEGSATYLRLLGYCRNNKFQPAYPRPYHSVLIVSMPFQMALILA